MLLHRSALAIALLLTANVSHADAFLGSLDFNSGGAYFGRNDAVGIFEDIYAFSLVAPGYLISASVGTASPSPEHDLDLLNPRITTAGGSAIATFEGNRGNDANESYWLTSLFLPEGNYKLIIGGTDSHGQASYAGSMSIASAVPEPKAYALFLAGLGALLALSRRRRRTHTS
jgi:PEP-CTERM motif